MKERRFASHASDAFNEFLEEATEAIASDADKALGDNLHALLLGGGYARGEGGVLVDHGEERPYNDLDFVIVVHRKNREIPDQLRPLSQKHSAILGIDVDFSRPLTVNDINRWPHWLMWTDLLGGHRVLRGPQNILTANAPAHLSASPPMIEATRLLLNRGAGLLWAMRIRRNLEQPDDPDFVRRNAHKCELAIGDVVIMANARHQVRYEGRDELLERLLAIDERAARFALTENYRAALHFRLRPGPPDGEAFGLGALEQLADRWGEAWLYAEKVRTGLAFSSLEQYSAWRGLREPEQHTPYRLLRNMAKNLQRGRLDWRYPRESLFRDLPGLLVLNRHCPCWEKESQAFLDCWRSFN